MERVASDGAKAMCVCTQSTIHGLSDQRLHLGTIERVLASCAGTGESVLVSNDAVNNSSAHI